MISLLLSKGRQDDAQESTLLSRFSKSSASRRTDTVLGRVGMGERQTRIGNTCRFHPRASVPVCTEGRRAGPQHDEEQREPRDRSSGCPEPSGGRRAQLCQGGGNRTSKPGKCIRECLASQVVGTGHCLLDFGLGWGAGGRKHGSHSGFGLRCRTS